MKTKDIFIDKQNRRTEELKGLITNHSCTLYELDWCPCEAYTRELEMGERDIDIKIDEAPEFEEKNVIFKR